MPRGATRFSCLAVSGIGARSRCRRCARAHRGGVSALMTFGLAGALDPALQAGSVVLPSELISRDGARFATCRRGENASRPP